MRRFATFVLLALLPALAAAQEQPSTLGEKLLADPSVKAAVAAAQANESKTLDEQVRICEIPAPTGSEGKRAEYIRKRFDEIGLANVRIDRAGNVLGERAGQAAAPHLVFSAHLDTVFPEGTDVKVTREGAVFKGPGIGDDCRGLAVILAVATALREA
jgi:acetylornithine deacetylase/succinyl-diaminopimelate desuccinylase-like protein